NAKSLLASRHFVEDDAGSGIGMHHDVGGHADLFLPARPAHYAHFAELVGFGNPFAQIAISILMVQPRRSSRLLDGHGSLDRLLRSGGFVARSRYHRGRSSLLVLGFHTPPSFSLRIASLCSPARGARRPAGIRDPLTMANPPGAFMVSPV